MHSACRDARGKRTVRTVPLCEGYSLLSTSLQLTIVSCLNFLFSNHFCWESTVMFFFFYFWSQNVQKHRIHVLRNVREYAACVKRKWAISNFHYMFWSIKFGFWEHVPEAKMFPGLYLIVETEVSEKNNFRKILEIFEKATKNRFLTLTS